MADRNAPGSPAALLHFDGANGSTSFPDATGRVWTPVSSVSITTGQSKFGGASGEFAGGRLTTPADTNLAFGTGDFTWECWLRTTTSRAGTGAVARVVQNRSAASGAGTFQIWQNDAGSQFGTVDSITLANPASTGIICDLGVVITDGAWHHIAFARQGTTLRGFYDGVLKSTVTDSTSFTTAGTDGISIGTSGSGGTPFIGNIDEVRITKGVAWYTASFTPLAAPFGVDVVAQSLAGVSQVAAATVTASADRSLSAAQTVASVTQAATGSTPAKVAVAQSLSGVVQAAATTLTVNASAAQATAGVSQAATAIVSGGSASINAAQTLAGVAQSAALAHVAFVAAAQVLDAAAQAATAQILAHALGSQVLADVSQSATADVQLALSVGQQLDGVSQTASATVTEAVRAFLAAQVLAAVTQAARMRHEYVFERNERTLAIAAERRGYLVTPEARGIAVAGERRAVVLVGESRRIAFTD